MSDKKNILVTGANGQLGMEFRELSQQFPHAEFFFLSKADLEIADAAAVENYFSGQHVDVCINCAAYTAVDKAEQEQSLAMAINATAVGNLAATCASHGSRLIHFSTDYVFSGESDRPYVETDPTAPVNFYGHTKLAGEKLAIQHNPNAVIIRTSWVYSRYGKNFVKTMQRLFAEKKSLGVVADQFGCPTYAADLAHAVMSVVHADRFEPGVYHYANEGIISWHEFAVAIRDLENSDCIVNAIETKDYPTPAARPRYSAFDTSKIASVYPVTIHNWRKSLAICLAG